MGKSLSVVDFLLLGSALAVRSFAKLGSSLAAQKQTSVSSSLAVRTFPRMGASLSVLGLSQLSSSLSVLDYVTVGSSLSLRSMPRLSSGLSVLGVTQLGSSLAVLDHVCLGSSLALRNSARIGGTLKASGLHFSPGITALEDSHGDLVFTVQGNKTMTLTSTGGMLHGTWTSEQMVTASDARLKTGIMPIRQFVASQKHQESAGGASAQGTQHRGPLARLLMGLRPVAYRYRRREGRQRFGFVAQDLEHHLPDVVEQLPSAAEASDEDEAATNEDAGGALKGFVYQDLIAVLAAAFRNSRFAWRGWIKKLLSLGHFSASARILLGLELVLLQ